MVNQDLILGRVYDFVLRDINGEDIQASSHITKISLIQLKILFGIRVGLNLGGQVNNKQNLSKKN